MDKHRGRTERRKRVRRIDDVHLPSPDQREGAPPEAGGAMKLRRPLLVGFLCAPALAILAWTALGLIEGSQPFPLILVALLAVVWLAGLGQLLHGSRVPWTISDLTRLRTLRAVRHGMERDEFELHYQPQLNIQSGMPCGVEALLRWRRDDELVLPGDYLPVVESSDLIGRLTERVLGMALKQAGAWQRAGHSIRVAVNLSAGNLGDFAVVGQVERLLEEHGVAPASLVLEITETAVLENPEKTRAVLEALAELGVGISIDDFGVGYSSLLWLQIFPVDEVKVDRSFVAQVDGEGEAFVEGVVRLARDLSLRVVAEGIEEESALTTLQTLGCEGGQGFLFSPAMPADEVEAWFDSHRETTWARRETTVSIAPEFDQISKARDMVEERAIEAGMSDSDVWDLRVAVTEALANAIEHGARAEDNLIHVRIAAEKGELRLDVAGGGRAGNGAASPPRGPDRGRGIAVMTGTMDRLSLTHDRDRNLIQLAKSLTEPGDRRRAD